MPSPEKNISGTSSLQLENTLLRRGRELSQPRRRLALTLPGSDYLINSEHHLNIQRPDNLLLRPSWEKEASMRDRTTNSLLSSNLKLTSPSKLALTSNRILNAKQFPTSSTLTSILSYTAPSSEPYVSTETSRPAVTSNSSLHTNRTISTLGNLSSDSNEKLQSSLNPNLVTSNTASVYNPALIPHLATSNITQCDSGNSVCLQQIEDSGVPLYLVSTLGDNQENQGPASQDDVTTQTEETSYEADSIIGGLSSRLEETLDNWLPKTLPPIRPKEDEKLTVEENSTIKSRHQSLLHQKKMELVSAVCCSLVSGPKFSDSSDETRAKLQALCEELSNLDSEFILKVALYTRQELNIRSTANFMLAVSAFLPACRPHLRRYFCASIQLPADWMEVPRLYQSLAGQGDKLVPLPSCLRRVLTLKFQEFTEYQLAKYNTRRQRGKHSVRKPRVVNCQSIMKIGRNLRSMEEGLRLLQKKFSTPPTLQKKTKDKFSMKSLIQRLHISKPAHHVMSILGYKYPKDLYSFSKSGLEGPWQSDLSDQKMKLKQPQTWERELSLKGNTGPAWEKLLDSNQVPFMALVRNLRNMIRAGISQRHHNQVTARLSSESAVIKSRLFPFRFLSAYKVIQDLEMQCHKSGKPFPVNRTLIKGIVSSEAVSIPKLKRFYWSRRQLRGCLAVPAIRRLLKRKKAALRKLRDCKMNQTVLQKYKKALESAVKISARHNIAPLPGRTVILFYVSDSMHKPCHGAKDLSVMLEDVSEEVSEEDSSQQSSDHFQRKNSSPTLFEVGLLLSGMVRDTSESAQLVLFNDHSYILAEFNSSSLLHNVSHLKKQAEDLMSQRNLPFQKINVAKEYLLELLGNQTKVDTLLLFKTSPPNTEFKSVLQHYRKEVNADCLCVTVVPKDFQREESDQCSDDGHSESADQEISEESSDQCNDVILHGFTEQVLRYVSERGTARLLDHVSKVNERFQVPEDPDTVKRSHDIGHEMVPFPIKQRWRSIRIFISSTFRDMHSERNLIIGQVIPELRSRAAGHYLSVEEVDLRWGITEEETRKDRQLHLCLSEVCKSQIFIGILGERYGHVPKTYSVPLLPEYEWIQRYPPGRSITELEAMQFLQNSDTENPGHHKAFFYLREPDVLHSIPRKWLPDFAAESAEAEMKMSSLKSLLKECPSAASYRYSSQWGGELHGNPHLTGLKDFGIRVLEDIWQVIEHNYIKEGALTSNEDEEELAQEGFQERQARLSCARNKLVLSMCSQIQEKTSASPSNGRLFLVCGERSQGKTIFMADLVKQLRSSTSTSVIYHFTGATPGALEVENMLTRICKQLSQSLNRECCNFTSYRALLSEFHYLLRLTSHSLKKNNTLTLLIDGSDLLCGRAGETTSEWIPEHLPSRVNLVLSVTEGSSLGYSLARRKDIVSISISSLQPSERAEVVRRWLAVYGKKLEESAFNNQMRLLLIKKGTKHPLYLTMACEELRATAVFERLSDDIEKLPATLPVLIQRRLESLEQEHGVTTVSIALAVICLSRKGLPERDLLRILSSLQALNCVFTAKWDAMLAAFAGAHNLPMATFALLLSRMRSVLGLWLPALTSDHRLHLPSCLLRDAVEKRYLMKSEVTKAAHLLMAAYFWTVCSPEEPESAPVITAEYLSELSHHLLCSGQLHTLGRLLTNLPFLRTHAALGLLPHLCQVYSKYDILEAQNDPVSKVNKTHDQHVSKPPLEVFREFIQHSVPVLSQSPSLFYQQALNEPDCSPVCIQARAIMDNRKERTSHLTMMWNNKPSYMSICHSKSLQIPSQLGCVSLCPSGRMAAVGASNGSLHLINTDSGEEARLLHSGCDGISACRFISDDLLCVASYDGVLEIWKISDGCRMHRAEAHQRQITGCCVSPDQRQFVTCSLDYQLKLWESSRGSLLGSISFPYPLDCTTFHPSGHAVAVGSWDGKITVLRLENWEKTAVLCGSSSVKAVSFSQDGKLLVSGSLDGLVSLWSWETQVQLSHFRAHSGSTLTCCFLQYGECLLTGGEDGKVQVWSGGLGRLLGRVDGEIENSSAISLAVSPSKQLLVVGYHSGAVSVYNVDSGDLVAQTCIEDVTILCLAWLSEEVLVTGTSDSLVRVWKISAGQFTCQLMLNGHQRFVQALAVSSKLLASASGDVSVCLWSLNGLLNSVSPPSPASVLQGHSAAVTCCSFSQSGRLLATGSQDRSVLCWDVSLTPPSVVHALPLCHRDWVTACSWTDADMLVSCSGDGSVCLWDIQREERLLDFAGHQSAVSSVICMGERVITTSRDGRLKVWNLTGIELANISAHQEQINQSAAFWMPVDSQDDAALVVYVACSDGLVLKWSPLQMDQIQTLYGHGGPVISSSSSSSSSSKCKVIATASLDGSVRLWEEPSRNGNVMETRHVGRVSAIAYSPDSELVVSGGESGNVILWSQQRVLFTVQCSKMCISHLLFTSQRTFCVISNDLKVSRWILLPCKGGGLRAKKAYSIEVDSLVVSVSLAPTNNELELQTLNGHRMILNIKNGSLKQNGRHTLHSNIDQQIPRERMYPGSIITASQADFGLCDSAGGLWCPSTDTANLTTAEKWERKQIHSASVSCLHVLDEHFVTGSADRTVKVWERRTYRQIGLFQCKGAVTCLSAYFKERSEFCAEQFYVACGDQYGNVYLLSCF
ncbi:telomerase protein component 1 [Xenopus laevis]|uniref:Telomerase protein component 1 n=2 Tax=Xenopus laevis TaxID=8355 RepID=A0A1L8HZP5_XENLA|nr:telomerase protein component 1 [Xenopus laevis]XP_041421519.1 telomerase protein component 1 [Xenopus laevis]XP_041421520.1 telomerase protein component 1 [Xenopus laevis]OCU01586.1 hypothetical protein XELAEV_18007377mg [Xenopus laevis]